MPPPRDMPHRSTVYVYHSVSHRRGRLDGTRFRIQKIHEKPRPLPLVREKGGRAPYPGAAIVDSQRMTLSTGSEIATGRQGRAAPPPED